ncbi:MAG: hypothetical protein ACI4V1_06950, partial [Eubacteriales bacterium]
MVSSFSMVLVPLKALSPIKSEKRKKVHGFREKKKKICEKNSCFPQQTQKQRMRATGRFPSGGSPEKRNSQILLPNTAFYGIIDAMIADFYIPKKHLTRSWFRMEPMLRIELEVKQMPTAKKQQASQNLSAEINGIDVQTSEIGLDKTAYANNKKSTASLSSQGLSASCLTKCAAPDADLMRYHKYLGATTYSPGTYTAWCPTGLLYDDTRDVYAHFMNVQNRHYQTPNACELWFNTIHPATLEHSEPVLIARTAESLSTPMVCAGALGCCIKNGNYYMFSEASKGY